MAANDETELSSVQVVLESRSNWRKSLLGNNEGSDRKHAQYLTVCAQQILGRACVYDSKAAITLNANLASTYLPVISGKQEYEGLDDLMDAIRSTLAEEKNLELDAKEKFDLLVASNLEGWLLGEREECWKTIQSHPYYILVAQTALSSDELATEAAVVLLGIKRNLWEFFNRRYTYIVLRSVKGEGTGMGYISHLLLKDDENFKFTGRELGNLIAEDGVRQENNVATIRESWPLENSIREKVFDALTEWVPQGYA